MANAWINVLNCKHRRGLAKFGQKQYPSALVRYWALARAEVFQFGFLFLSLFSVTTLGSGSGQTIFKYPNFAKPYPSDCEKTLSPIKNSLYSLRLSLKRLI